MQKVLDVKWDLQVMLRLARLDAPGVLHHVMGRGIEQKKIFLSDMDRNDFIGRLSALGQDGAMAVILPIASSSLKNLWQNIGSSAAVSIVRES